MRPRVKEVLTHPSALRGLWGLFICTAAAKAFILLFHNMRDNTLVPLFFLLVVGVVAWFLGTWAAILGLVTGSVIFAVFLFPPVGKLLIASEAARVNVAVMLIFGIGIAYFYGHSSTS